MRIAIIPARGGSKRIPRKNVRSFAGRPMISYSIECAQASGIFDRVLVSTDDGEIAGVARACGAEVPFMRPRELADDYTGTTEVTAHAVEQLRERGVQASAVCCIYATAPFIRAEDLRRGLQLLASGAWRYVFAATSYAFPIFRSFRFEHSQGVRMLFPEHAATRSQDLPEILHDAGQFYWGQPQAWLERASIFSRHSAIVRIPRWRVQDIDTDEDWARAEAMSAYLGEG